MVVKYHLSDTTIRFFLLCTLGALTTWALQVLLISDSLYVNSFAEVLSYERIEQLVAMRKKWEWLGYIAIPLIYLIKFTLVAACLSLGYYIVANRFGFRHFWRVVIQAEFVFLLPVLLKLVWFLFIRTDYTLDDLTRFYPFSALTLFDVELIKPYLFYPLQVLNIFELAYWLLLAYYITQTLDWSFERALGLVMSSYGVGLLLWVVLIMFLTITFT